MNYESKRLVFRDFNEFDVQNLSLLDSDKEVMKFLTAGITFSFEESKQRLLDLIEDNKRNSPLGTWAVDHKNSGDFVGRFMLKQLSEFDAPSIGYRLIKKYWGEGFATEGVSALVKYGFENLNLDKIVAITSPKNKPSIRVLEKSGFSYIQNIKFFNPIPKKEVDTQFFEILNPERGGSRTSYDSAH